MSFQIFFRMGTSKHNIHNREGRRKEIKQTRTWVSSKRKKGEVCDTFLAFCVYGLVQMCIQAKFPQSPGMPTHPLTLANSPLNPQALVHVLVC